MKLRNLYLIPMAILALSGPAMAGAASAHPKVRIVTSVGNIEVTLYTAKAPLSTANFLKYADRGFYDGTVFHRVIPGFMIQTGDPMGNGAGDAGYSFKDEFSDLRFDRPGRLAMANSGRNTNSSQFFITEAPTPHLNGKHTIFGQCEPAALVRQISHVSRDLSNDKPIHPVKLIHIQIKNAK